MNTLMTLLVACLCGVSCSVGFASTEALRDELVRRNLELIGYGEAGEMEAALEMHASDAVLIPPSAAILTGDAVRRALGNPAGATVQNTKIEVVQAGGNGDLAYSVGTFEYEVVRGDGTSTVRGPFVIVWTRSSAGEWQVQVDMWNLDRSGSAQDSVHSAIDSPAIHLWSGQRVVGPAGLEPATNRV